MTRPSAPPRNETALEVGDEWIYRRRDYAPSERVRIAAIHQRKQSFRADIEYLDGEKEGSQENVPGGRLKAAWADVKSYDARWAGWERIQAESDTTDIEISCLLTVFELLVPEDVIEIDWGPVHNAALVHDSAGFERLTGVALSAFRTKVASFDDDGVVVLSPEGAVLIAELAAHQNPLPVLDWVVEEEAKCRELCKRGGTRDGYNYEGVWEKDQSSSPEWEYARYRRYDRPLHELLRQWCGHRAISFQERLTAAEAEVHRLDIMVATLIDLLKKDDNGKRHAEDYEREHNEEHITAETVRPIVDRPLAPWEMPVREVRVRSGRWW